LAKNKFPPSVDIDRFARKKRELIQRLSHRNPQQLGEYTSSTFEPDQTGGGRFLLKLWETDICLTYPDFVPSQLETGQLLTDMDRVLLLYYFDTADGAPAAGKWISFSELPDGKFYNQAFQGYTGRQLSLAYQNDQDLFNQSAKRLNGHRFSLADSSYKFEVLPRVSLLVVFWLGDEDFPSSFQILFDASASHYLPTDAYAILGSTITGRLINAKKT
jgi:hypothetical protein